MPESRDPDIMIQLGLPVNARELDADLANCATYDAAKKQATAAKYNQILPFLERTLAEMNSDGADSSLINKLAGNNGIMPKIQQVLRQVSPSSRRRFIRSLDAWWWTNAARPLAAGDTDPGAHSKHTGGFTRRARRCTHEHSRCA
jgi:hypothetical protein